MAIIEAESQEKLLYLLINHSSLVPDFLSQQIGLEFFEPKYRPIIAAIELAHNSSEQFTENYFIDYIIKSVSNGDYKKLTGNDAVGVKIAQTNERRNYHSVATLDKVDPADFPLVCRKVRENYIKNKSGDLLDKFNKKRQQDYVSAVTLLSEELTSLVSNNSETGASTWVTIDDFYDNWYKSLEQEINNPKKVLLTGIKPFDETMPIGLDPGSLTLIVADVGGFKSATMINIALNVCKVSNENVLYVSLEMPKDRLMQRIISRESGVDSEKLSKPSMLTVEEKSKIENAGKDFKKISAKFSILDAQERMSVSKIRAEIEKRIHFFKPRLVVIDYITILSPESWYQKLAEHSWYGQMCKDLRQLGRKIGFAVLSAVQLNREAIKSLRNQKDGKQTVGSDALRGSHDFSADSDNIFVQFPHPEEPKNKLYLVCVKSRYGSTMFGQLKNQTKATLDVIPSIGKVTAYVDPTWENNLEGVEFIKKADSASAVAPNLDLDLSFDNTPPPAPKKKPKIVQPTIDQIMGF